jgi:hypothetical protein
MFAELEGDDPRGEVAGGGDGEPDEPAGSPHRQWRLVSDQRVVEARDSNRARRSRRRLTITRDFSSLSSMRPSALHFSWGALGHVFVLGVIEAVLRHEGRHDNAGVLRAVDGRSDWAGRCTKEKGGVGPGLLGAGRR